MSPFQDLKLKILNVEGGHNEALSRKWRFVDVSDNSKAKVKKARKSELARRLAEEIMAKIQSGI